MRAATSNMWTALSPLGNMPALEYAPMLSAVAVPVVPCTLVSPQPPAATVVAVGEGVGVDVPPAQRRAAPRRRRYRQRSAMRIPGDCDELGMQRWRHDMPPCGEHMTTFEHGDYVRTGNSRHINVPLEDGPLCVRLYPSCILTYTADSEKVVRAARVLCRMLHDAVAFDTAFDSEEDMLAAFDTLPAPHAVYTAWNITGEFEDLGKVVEDAYAAAGPVADARKCYCTRTYGKSGHYHLSIEGEPEMRVLVVGPVVRAARAHTFADVLASRRGGRAADKPSFTHTAAPGVTFVLNGAVTVRAGFTKNSATGPPPDRVIALFREFVERTHTRARHADADV